MILAYCTRNFPNKPVQSSITYSQSLNNSGQIATIRCNSGFVFTGTQKAIQITTPTTTTTTLPPLGMSILKLLIQLSILFISSYRINFFLHLEWEAFEGAEYSLSYDYLPWNDAKSACENAGGNLASITDYAVQKFIISSFGDNENMWIGATDSGNEGTFTWSNGNVFSYYNWEDCTYQPSEDGNDCAMIESGKHGRWVDQNCAENLRYICQRGTSISQLWNEIHGAEYAFLHSIKCITSFADAQQNCQHIGGELASIQSQEIMDELLNTFDAFVTGNVIIGAKDDINEGTFRWVKGENFIYTNWKNGEPQNSGDKDCVYMESGTGDWVMFNCEDNDADSALCMRGTSTSFDTTTSAPVGWTFKKLGSSGFRYVKNWRDDKIKNYVQGPDCCNKCGSESSSTKWITFDTASGSDTCWCFYSIAEPPIEVDWGWKRGSCTYSATGRKKRHGLGWGELISSQDSLSKLTSSIISRTKDREELSVVKRNVQNSLNLEMEITCEAMWSDTANYWNYHYEVPDSCWSKQLP